MRDFSKEFNFTILMIVLILITILAGAGLALKEQYAPKKVEPVVESYLTKNAKDVSDRVYKYKGTKYNEFDKINSIVKNLDFLGFRFVSAEPSENDENIYTLSYKADSRSKFRIMSDYNRNFYQTSVTLFSLVDDLSGVRISVSDDYGEFCSFFVQRYALHENTYTRTYTPICLENAVSTKENFVKFLEGIIILNIPVEEKNFEREIYKTLSPNLELIEGSITEISSRISKDNLTLLSKHGINDTNILNRPCDVKFYSVNDYIKHEISPYIFIFAEGKLLAYSKLENEKVKSEILAKLK